MKLWGSVLVAVVGLTACQSENPNNCAWIVGTHAENVRKVDGGWRFTTADTVTEVMDTPITGDVWLATAKVVMWGEEYCQSPDTTAADSTSRAAGDGEQEWTAPTSEEDPFNRLREERDSLEDTP